MKQLRAPKHNVPTAAPKIPQITLICDAEIKRVTRCQLAAPCTALDAPAGGAAALQTQRRRTQRHKDGNKTRKTLKTNANAFFLSAQQPAVMSSQPEQPMGAKLSCKPVWPLLGHDSPAELEEDLLKDQNRARAAQDGERLPGEQRVGHARQRRAKQRLNGTLSEREREGSNTRMHQSGPRMSSHRGSYYAPFGGLPEQTSEGDDGRHAGAVQEEDGGQALQAHGVSDVAPVERRLPPNVVHQTAKNPVGHTRDSPSFPTHSEPGLGSGIIPRSTRFLF